MNTENIGRHLYKLNADQVIAIRRAITAGEKPESLALKYNVSYGTIVAIKSGRTWKHLLEASKAAK